MITVIIPIYNAELYLENCLLSIVNQIYKDWQLILVDDGSTDSSLEICKKYEKLDSRIIVFSQENRGQAAARNYGLQQVKTPYVTFVDADDEIAEDTLSSNMQTLLNDQMIDVLQYPVFMNYATEQQYIRKPKTTLIQTDFYKAWLDSKQISWVIWDKIYKTSLFENVTFKEGIVYEDNLMILNLIEIVKKVCISEEGLYYYYTRGNSTMTSANTRKKEEDSFYVTTEITRLLFVKKNKDILIEFLVRLINIRKSLKHNYSSSVTIDKNFLSIVSKKDIILAKIDMKSKFKLLIEKYAN
ncbi:Glycosyltransferase involved in cell wall bisynthesis [Soonwooa buanensis]|uniref:Glycosyltransferase involved in cell wall bisynthesis n=1 Tax=Soonwooa buanensis TaxID=619805 RepID=A0A1T5FIR4_9FLAO|nr:glycosyltransferase family 2 protein [Soonwooa buanensis]SKB95966.1 Glycosyltransferase involved in cell wall bisynthesis [Soonwooa buanensis]